MGGEVARASAEEIINAGVQVAVAKANAAPKRLRNETYTLEMILVLTDAVLSLREDVIHLKAARG